MHGFGRLKTTRKDADPGTIIGESAVTAEMFADLWARLARLYKDSERVIFELMNEPHDQNTDILLSTYNTVISAIRAQGARNLVLLDGNTWSGASSWVKPWDGSVSNAAAMLRIVDPADNYAFTPHEYLDGHGGTLETCLPGATERGLPAVTEWARQHGFRLLLGEFGGGDNPVCHEEIAKMIAFVERNDDVWFGWTYFGAYAGQRSYNIPDNFFHGIDPPDYGAPVDSNRTRVLRRFLPKG
jgi:endoglucanase